MKKIITGLLFVYLCFIAVNSFAQVIVANPLFPADNATVTLTYDAAQGNQALKDFNGDIYIHTGVITNYSTSPSDWKHVVTTWGSTNPLHKLTSLGNNLYTFTITNIRAYYNVPVGETILKLAMVFRNADGSIVGRNADGSDIFYDVWDGVSLQTAFLEPDNNPVFLNLNETVQTTFIVSKPVTITLFQNNNLIAQVNNTDSITQTITASENGKTWIKAIADDGITQVADSFYFMVNTPVTVADLPSGAQVGINYLNDSSLTLVLTAPDKSFVYAIGDFSNWEADPAYFMNKTTDGKYWWLTVNNLVPQQEYLYQYLVDGNLRIADPYCDKILDAGNDPYISDATYPGLIDYPTGKTSGIVSVFQTAQTPFNWQVTSFTKPDPDNMVVYELLVRDFVSARNFAVLKDTLNYLKTLGVNVIELMPFSEFEGNESWGYNPDFYFAPDKYYGTKNMLKEFIDACHQQGIAVVQDMVLNHSFGQSPMVQLYWDAASNGPSASSPWFNPDQDLTTAGYQGKHPFGVGFDINHESVYTQKFVDDVLAYWVTQYKIDGFRFDLSKGFTQKYSGNDVGLWGQYDQSRINNLKRMMDAIKLVDPTVLLILEHFADQSEEQVLSNDGFYLWSNSNYAYAQSAMGYASSSDVSWVSYKSHGFSLPHAVGYMESHDEERITYKTITYGAHTASYDVRPLDESLNRMKMAACFFFTIPGPKMIWQFGELGYDYSINYCQNGTISSACRVDAKPVKWNYLDYNPRVWVYNFYKALIDLKMNYSVFQTTDFVMAVGNLKKNIRLNSPTMNVCVVGNFDISAGNQPPNFQHTGWWYEYFTGDSINVTDLSATLYLNTGEYRLYTDSKLAVPDLGNVGIDGLPELRSLQLFQNTPNPFDQNTAIEFYVPKAGKTVLEIYDLYGRLVKTVADKSLAAGYYTVNIPGPDFSNGIYLCKLTQNGMTKTIKMQVAK
ncbi:MAG: T9SS type A sorting domain-containing protein [Chitinophagales bacterium]|nr:T9SS type A sorting domain-containing protein [Chitinophagales bacterium]